MMYEKVMALPANCTFMTEEEMQYTEGGNAVQAVLGGVVAVGVSAALLYVGSIAVRGIFGMFAPETISTVVDSTKDAVGNLVDALK